MKFYSSLSDYRPSNGRLFEALHARLNSISTLFSRFKSTLLPKNKQSTYNITFTMDKAKAAVTDFMWVQFYIKCFS